MESSEGVTTYLSRVISAWQGFLYIILSLVVRMGGGESKTSGQETMASRAMFRMWTAQRESWWTSTSSSYENITMVGDTLTACYSLLESSWSVRSEGLCFFNEYKLRHSLSSCKTFLNLACLHEIRENAAEASYGFHMN